VCESLADSETLGELTEGQSLGIVGKQHLCMLDGGSPLGQFPHLPRQPLCSISPVKGPAHRPDAFQGRPSGRNCRLDSAVNVTHATSVQAVSVTPTDSFVHGIDGSVQAMYGHSHDQQGTSWPRGAQPREKGVTPMAPTSGPCASCGGRGTVQVQITNTATGKTQTITQTCLDCQFR
jgi:hypothetical protein